MTDIPTVADKTALTAIDIAEMLFMALTAPSEAMDANPEQVLYKAENIHELLRRLGCPPPDFAGYTKKVELELLTGPWDTVLEYFEPTEMPLAVQSLDRLGFSKEAVKRFISDDVPVDEAIATQLAAATKVPIRFWLNREALYRAKLIEFTGKPRRQKDGGI